MVCCCCCCCYSYLLGSKSISVINTLSDLGEVARSEPPPALHGDNPTKGPVGLGRLIHPGDAMSLGAGKQRGWHGARVECWLEHRNAKGKSAAGAGRGAVT